MLFTDTTLDINSSLAAGHRPYDLYLEGGGAEISVTGDERGYLVALYWNYNEETTYVSSLAYSWRTNSLELAVRLAWWLAKLLAPFTSADRWPNLIPARLRMYAVTGEVVTADVLD